MLIFEEHFLDDRNHWHQACTEDYDLFIANSYLLARHKRPNKYWVWWKQAGGHLYDNKDFHIHIVLEQAAGTPKREQYGVVWGALDANNLFAFLLTDEGYYHVCKCEQSTWRELIDWRQSPIVRSGDNFNILDIRRNKELVEFYINSELVGKLSVQIAMSVLGQNFGFMVCGENTIKVHSLVVSGTTSETRPTEKIQAIDEIKDNKLQASAVEHHPPVDDSLENVFADLNTLIGHDPIKQQFLSLANSLKAQTERHKRGLKTIDSSRHLVLLGPPGTGKTTIARLIGRLYKQLGYLEQGHVVETDRSGLIGAYLGQTAYRVDNAVEQARGGVLFIDEAYALVTQGGSSNDYGHEVVQVLLKRMEDYRDQFAVIVAGYTDEMQFFVESNPGLKSRFGQFFYFDHYTPNELFLIFQKFCRDYDYKIEDDAIATILEQFETAYQSRDQRFGNGRYVRTIFENSVTRQANRIAIQLDQIDNASISLITTADLKSTHP